MEHSVISFNCISKKVVYESLHRSAESAYEEYLENIRIVKRHIRKGEELAVARLWEGKIMAFEVIKGE